MMLTNEEVGFAHLLFLDFGIDVFGGRVELRLADLTQKVARNRAGPGTYRFDRIAPQGPGRLLFRAACG